MNDDENELNGALSVKKCLLGNVSHIASYRPIYIYHINTLVDIAWKYMAIAKYRLTSSVDIAIAL